MRLFSSLAEHQDTLSQTLDDVAMTRADTATTSYGASVTIPSQDTVTVTPVTAHPTSLISTTGGDLDSATSPATSEDDMDTAPTGSVMEGTVPELDSPPALTSMQQLLIILLCLCGTAIGIFCSVSPLRDIIGECARRGFRRV